MKRLSLHLLKIPAPCAMSVEFISCFLFLSGYFALMSSLALLTSLDDAYVFYIKAQYISEMIHSSALSAVLAVGGGLLIDLFERERRR